MRGGVTVSHIVAMAENRIIGAGGQLPWHIPEDFKFFKATTMGHAMLMGRKTFESIGRPLPGRLSLVLTRQQDYVPKSTETAPALAVTTVDEALALVESQAAIWGRELFVIGGGELYAATMEIVDRVYLTVVPRTVAGDTFYPPLPKDLVLREERPAAGDVACVFQLWTRAEAAKIACP